MKYVLIEVIGSKIEIPPVFDTFEEAFDRMAERAYEEAGCETGDPNCSCVFEETSVHCYNIYEERCVWKIIEIKC